MPFQGHIEPVRPRRGLRWWVMPWVMPRYIKRCWDRHGFDLLRAHSVRFQGLACLLARRRYKLPVPVIVHCHHLDPSPLNRVLERRVLRAADLVVVDSEATKRQVAGLAGSATKIKVIHPGVGPQYRPVGRSEIFSLGVSRVVAMGPLIPRKHPEAAIRLMHGLWRLAPRQLAPIRMIWIGGGPLLTKLRNQTWRAALEDRLTWRGHVDEQTKLALLGEAGVFFHPSELEGFALAPLEAMACGAPIVYRDIPSMREVVPDGCGLPFSSEDEAAEVVLSLLMDHPRRHRMAAAASAHMQASGGWDRTAKEVRAAYQGLLTSS